MGCHLSKPTASHEGDEFDAPSGQDAGRGNSAPLEQSRGASTAASMVLSEEQPATIVRGAPLQNPLAGAQPVDPRAVDAEDALNITVGSEFEHAAPQEACGPECCAVCCLRELPTFAPTVSPHDASRTGSETMNPQAALPTTSRRMREVVSKAVDWTDSDFGTEAISLASSRVSSGTPQRPPQEGSLPATPKQGSLMSAAAQQGSLPATPHQGSQLPTPQQRSLSVSVRCAGAMPQQGSPLSALLPATPQQRSLSSSAEINRAVHAKFKGNLLPGTPHQAPLVLVPLKPVTPHVDSSEEVNRAVHAKFKGNLLPAKR
jgi:hypothetical protein